jgi:cytochrome c oxidase subunit 3
MELQAAPIGVDKTRPLPGSEVFALGLLILSLAVLFASSLVGFFFVRASVGEWPAALPPLPPLLWAATGALVLTSAALHAAVRAARADHQRALRLSLWAALGLGSLFLGLQGANWLEYQAPLVAARARADLGGVRWLGQFYMLTALHGAHVVGGLIPLAITAWRARAGRYGPRELMGVRLCAFYWHFLDAVWVVIFAVLLLA